ncbi:MAG: hypothetical protein U9N76_04900, partial [Candidatus Marinimicrobia bacterium]|nr:hypothetical protein [Candidatus Neomarinimicrobiota bacterium]
MKKILLLILLINFSFAQNIEVESIQKLQTGNERFYFAKFNPNGESVLFSKDGYRGLYSYNLEEKTTTKLNDYTNAGYEPTFSQDGKDIYFRSDNFVNGK